MSKSSLDREIPSGMRGVGLAGPGSGLGTQVVRGSLWGLGAQAVALLASFLSTPFVIRLLGTESYGLLMLVNLIVGYLAFADLGMGVASTKFGAEALARGDTEGEPAVVWTSIVVAVPSVFLIATVVALAGGALVDWVFRISPALQNDATVALRLGAVLLVATAMTGVFNTSQFVRLRIDLNSAVGMSSSIAQACLIVVALWLGGGLRAVLAVMAGVGCVTAAANFVFSSKLSPGLLRPRIELKLLRPLLRFGLGIITIAIIGTVTVHGEKLLLARLGSLKMLAHYSLASTFAALLGILPAALAQPLMPSFIHLRSLEDRRPLERLYNDVLSGVILWMAPAALLLSVIARIFITHWAGPEYGRESVLPVYILVVGWLFNGVSYVPRNMLAAVGKVGLVARYQAAEFLPYFLATVILIDRFGAAGAAAAWSLRVIVESLLMFRASRRITGLRFTPFLDKRGAFALSLAALLVPVLVVRGTWPWPPLLFGVTGISLLLYGMLVLTRLLSHEQRSWIAARVARFWR